MYITATRLSGNSKDNVLRGKVRFRAMQLVFTKQALYVLAPKYFIKKITSFKVLLHSS